MQKLRSVQALRAVAVIAVVLHHYGSIEVGRAGVDLFFVISGFIMAHVMRGKTPASFLAARFWRIIPTYYAALALLFLVAGRLPSPGPLIQSLLLIPGNQLYLPQAWTLTYELMFYAGCALFMLRGPIVLVAIPAAWLATRFTSNPYVGIVGSPLFLEFLLGVAVALLPKRFGTAALMVGLAAFAIPVEADRLLTYGLPSAALLYGAVGLEERFGKTWDVPVLLGDASYSIYLVHWTLLAPLTFINLWLLMAYVAVLVSVIFYLAVERPLGRLPRLVARQTQAAFTST